MFWQGLSFAGVVLAVLGAVGCHNEADFQALLEENNTLDVELAEARQENEILTRALDDIKREQEALQLLFNAGKSSLNAGRGSLPAAVLAAGGDQAQAQAPGGDGEDEFQTPQPVAAPAPAAPAPASAPPQAVPAPTRAQVPATARAQAAPSGRYYVTKSGDVLSNIARANRTTVAKLLELNPNLRNRRNYMIYDNERLLLP
jgi:2-oxoglutarate dehydrogenase E2 component (dihydrolipoamide succinyltransferase)